MNTKVEGGEGDTGGRYMVGMDTGAISNTSMYSNIADSLHAQRSHFGVAKLFRGKISEIICDDYLLEILTKS